MAGDRHRLGHAAARLLQYAQSLAPHPAGSIGPPPLTLAQLALMLELEYHACVRALQTLTRRRQIRVRVFAGSRYQIRPSASL